MEPHYDKIDNDPESESQNQEESATSGDVSQYYQQEEYSAEEQDGEEAEFNVEDQFATQQVE
jgi:hypothetical protein